MNEAVKADERGPRFFTIVCIFTFAGPPIPGLIFGLLLLRENWAYATSSGEVMALLFGAAFFAYLIGAGPALAVGLIHAVLAVVWQKNSILVPLGSVVVVTIMSAALVWSNVIGSYNLPFIKGLVLFGPASLIASLICWRLTRRFARVA